MRLDSFSLGHPPLPARPGGPARRRARAAPRVGAAPAPAPAS